MRLWILAGILVIAGAIAYWAMVRQHEQARWVAAYQEATDSFERSHYADAEAQLRLLLPESGKADSHRSALVMNLLALVYQAGGHSKEAQPLFEKAIQIFEKEGPTSRMDLAKACNNEGRIYLEANRLQQAEQRIQQSLAIFQNDPAAAGAELGSALQNLGLVRRGQKRDAEAQALLEQAVQVFERNLPPTSLNLAQGYLDLAMQYRLEGRSKNAQETDQKALSIQERVFGAASPVVGETRARIASEASPTPTGVPAAR